MHNLKFPPLIQYSLKYNYFVFACYSDNLIKLRAYYLPHPNLTMDGTCGSIQAYSELEFHYLSIYLSINVLSY